MSVSPESAPQHKLRPGLAPEPPPVAPTARRLETRKRLLEAATEVFAEEGLRGATVEAICSRADFSRGAFYSNFESKEQLFLALFERELERRALMIETQAVPLKPALRERGSQFTSADAARYITDFFEPTADATTWFVLETEYLLLAMRDPANGAEYRRFVDRFYSGIAGAVEEIIEATGRRFSIPVASALPMMTGVYEGTLRDAAISGTNPEHTREELGSRLAELLFALTEPAA